MTAQNASADTGRKRWSALLVCLIGGFMCSSTSRSSTLDRLVVSNAVPGLLRDASCMAVAI